MDFFFTPEPPDDNSAQPTLSFQPCDTLKRECGHATLDGGLQNCAGHGLSIALLSRGINYSCKLHVHPQTWATESLSCQHQRKQWDIGACLEAYNFSSTWIMKHWHIGIKFANWFGASSVKSKSVGNVRVKEELHNRAQKKKTLGITNGIRYEWAWAKGSEDEWYVYSF